MSYIDKCRLYTRLHSTTYHHVGPPILRDHLRCTFWWSLKEAFYCSNQVSCVVVTKLELVFYQKQRWLLKRGLMYSSSEKYFLLAIGKCHIATDCFKIRAGPQGDCWFLKWCGGATNLQAQSGTFLTCTKVLTFFTSLWYFLLPSSPWNTISKFLHQSDVEKCFVTFIDCNRKTGN